MDARTRYNQLKEEQEKKRYKKGWIFYRMCDEFGKEVAAQFCEKTKINKQADPTTDNFQQPFKTGDYVIVDGKPARRVTVNSFDNETVRLHFPGEYAKVYKWSDVSLASDNDRGVETKTGKSARKAIKREMGRSRYCTCDEFDYIEDGCFCGAEYNEFDKRHWS